MDLGQDKMVSGVVIQGGKHRDRNVFMKRFKVGHSLDGEEWTMVKEDNSNKPKVGLLMRLSDRGRNAFCCCHRFLHVVISYILLQKIHRVAQNHMYRIKGYLKFHLIGVSLRFSLFFEE